MTSKIKVDNIENQCGGAVVTKCGGTTTITGSVVKSNAIQASDGGNLVNQCGTTITLGASGDTINLASGASQSGFGRTGTVDWDTTPKTATFSAVSGEGYFCNTSGGAFTVNLPAGAAGAIVSLADYAATFQTNTLTITPNGTDKIGSVNASVSLTTEGQSVTLVFVDSTQGWVNTMDSTSNVRGSAFVAATGGTILTCGNFKTHIFTGPGTFTVTNAGTPAGSDIVDYLVVAGGAGGGQGGGGGGAGGFRVSNSVGCIAAPVMSPLANPTGLPVSAQAYPITIGSGGTAGADPTPGGNGNNSIFSSITSAGGGGGRSSPIGVGVAGGSGGGGKGSSSPSFIPDSYPGGTGNTPPVSPPQGNNGGGGYDGFIATTQGGGGGGAGATGGSGQQSPPSLGGTGGDGSFIADAFVGPTAASYGTPGPVGSTRYFAGGGGGYSNNPSPSAPAPGGVGGGGTGQSPGGGGLVGTANTGGGGGSNTPNGNTGGSGIVIIRYKFQ